HRLRAVHAQDDLVREPVRREVGRDGEDEPEHEALSAAERFAQKHQRPGHRAEEQCGLYCIRHFLICGGAPPPPPVPSRLRRSALVATAVRSVRRLGLLPPATLYFRGFAARPWLPRLSAQCGDSVCWRPPPCSFA